MIRVGTSGWVYKHWRERFYPAGLAAPRWLSHYAREFNTVEINTSFYRLPPPETFDRWRERAPSGFLYAVKANRFITHIKKLKEPEEPLRRFLGAARRLKDRLGPILFQLPPNWTRDPERLRAFVERLPRDLLFAFEFRHPSWLHLDTRRLLDDAGIGTCMHDLRHFPCPGWVTGRLAYVRFHGPGERAYGGSYPRAALRSWAERLAGVDRDVYAYFNNDAEGHAIENARELIAMLPTSRAA